MINRSPSRTIVYEQVLPLLVRRSLYGAAAEIALALASSLAPLPPLLLAAWTGGLLARGFFDGFRPNPERAVVPLAR